MSLRSRSTSITCSLKYLGSSRSRRISAPDPSSAPAVPAKTRVAIRSPATVTCGSEQAPKIRVPAADSQYAYVAES
ncbi:hypothetical protein GCM10020295_22420 [Streptomyces cinereospinus]